MQVMVRVRDRVRVIVSVTVCSTVYSVYIVIRSGHCYCDFSGTPVVV